jgi:hypothetical protein
MNQNLPPVCIRLCLVSEDDLVKELPQTAQTKGFKPVCVDM